MAIAAGAAQQLPPLSSAASGSSKRPRPAAHARFREGEFDPFGGLAVPGECGGDSTHVLVAGHGEEGGGAVPFEEAVAQVPADKLLGGALHSLAAHAMGRTMDMDTLHEARQTRNWIAHEGASIGAVCSADRDLILQHAVKLRTAVTDLALGDNIISQWCHGLEEPHDPPPTDWINSYPDAVDTWGFGHLRGLLPVQASILASSE